MATAALVAGWERLRGKWASLTTMPHGGAGTVGGVPFCQDEFGAGAYLRVRIAFGAVLSNPSSSWTFTDVTSDVMQADGNFINIEEIGKPNEAIQVPPGSCLFRLDNRQDLYSKNNPLGPNWPNVRSNTPVVIDATLDGGANWGILFWGEIATWQPSWDTTGDYAVTDIQAYGRMQRLEAHSTPLKSAIYRSVSSAAPAYWWPMEDGSNSTTAASAVAGIPAYPFQGGVSFDTTDSPAGGGGSANITSLLASPKRFSLPTVLIPGGTVGGSFACGFWLKIVASSGTWAMPLLNFVTPGSSNTSSWFLRANNTNRLLISALNSSGGETEGVGLDDGTVNMADGNWHFIWFSLQKESSTQARVNGGIDQGSAGTFVMTVPHDVEQVTAMSIGATLFVTSGTNITQASMSNLFIFPNVTTLDYYNAGIGWAGETPGARMTRLCAEEGVEFGIVQYYTTNTVMGPQVPDTFMNIMRECSDSDAGLLYDALSAGLQFQGISQRYDQAIGMTLDATEHEMRPEFKPIDDDLHTVNRATVNNKNGSSVVFEQTDGPLGTGPDGIGVVDAQVSVNFNGDSRLLFRASWEAWAGTVEGFRYPVIPLNLRAHPSVASNWLNRTDGWGGIVTPGVRLDVLNISSWATQHPPGTVPLSIEGWAMRLTNLMWELDLVCTPNRKYDVYKVGDPQLGKTQTSGSVLTADAPLGATSVVFMATGAVGWTTDAGDFPMYLDIDGIKVTATSGIGGGLNFQYSVDPATITKPLLTGAPVKVWHTGVTSF